jgi:hypothetical protein
VTESKKPAFPQTPEGVTDWEQVFEGPSGLVALIGSARSAQAVSDCANVVISQLFTRKQDQLEVARLTHHLSTLVKEAELSGDIDQLTSKVALLLRQIKTERIQKAQDFLAAKTRKRRNRRSEKWSSRLPKNTYRLINDPKFALMVGGGAFVLMIAVLAIVINISTDGKLIEAIGFGSSVENETEQVQQPEPPAAEPEPKPEPEAEPTKRPADKIDEPEMPPALVIQRVFLPRITGTSQKGAGQVLPILVLAKRSDLSDICRIKPIFLDALNGQLSRVQNKRKLTDGNLAAISSKVMKRLNEKLGRKAVTRMLLVRGADHRDRAPMLCTLASEKFLKYIIVE